MCIRDSYNNNKYEDNSKNIYVTFSYTYLTQTNNGDTVKSRPRFWGSRRLILVGDGVPDPSRSKVPHVMAQL